MTESGSEALEGPISLDKLRTDRASSSLPSFSFFLLLLTSHNLFDLGIAIAAGIAGAFSLTRKSVASSIAGVAIAVALVPPCA